MPGIQLGWIDFSKEQRNKVLSVINLLAEPEAVDELGIGVIRDAFSEIFFPGTSVLLTRAKYFLIVPYLLYELERENLTNPERMLSKLHEQEIELIEVFKKNGETGVIGVNAGKKLKRKPSELYWNGIKKYGIFTGGNLSLYEYLQIVCSLNERRKKLRNQGSLQINEGDGEGDDKDALAREFTSNFWKLPDFPENWRENLTMKLTLQEAEFLRNQIRLSCPDSLLGYILEKKYIKFLLFQDFDEIEGILNILPDNIKLDYLMAKAFRDFIYGAHIRYNVILSKGNDDKVNKMWQEWSLNMQKYAEIDLEKIVINRLKIKNISLYKFLNDCKEAMKAQDIKTLDEIIVRRERKLKGDKRSKLYNAAAFDHKGWVGINKLQYRMKIGINILKDIFEGLGEYNA